MHGKLSKPKDKTITKRLQICQNVDTTMEFHNPKVPLLCVSVCLVVPTLSKSSSATAPVALQVVVLFLLALCFLFSAITMLVSLYNSVSNPYETYLGPVGIYVYSSVNGT